jgi:thioredoxin 1
LWIPGSWTGYKTNVDPVRFNAMSLYSTNTMKSYIRIGLFVFLMLLQMEAFAQVEFIEVTTAEEMAHARKKAADQDQMLFVDVYATWCGPCKIMDREVYANLAVGEYMNSKFVNVRMDGETDYGRKYAAEQKLEGYPSMYIFSPQGDPLSRLIGFSPADELLMSLKGLVENYELVRKYRSKYEDGTITMEDFAEYVAVVRKMGNEEQAENLAGEYIKKQMGDDLSDNDIRVVAFYMDLEDPWWPDFRKDPERIQRVLGNEYMAAMEKIYNNSLVKAVEQENIGLVSRMANELSPLINAREEVSWDLRSLPFIQYYYYTGQMEALIDYVDKRFASDRTGDHRWLFGAASRIVDLDQQYQTPLIMQKSEEWFNTCIALDEQYDYYFYRGMVLFFQQKAGEAKTSFEKAGVLATTEEEKAMIAQVLQYIDGR